MIKFSQNDPKWKKVKMGISNCTLGNYGCATSDVATLGSWFGDTLTPKDYAKCKSLYTSGGYILWNKIPSKVIKFKSRVRNFDENLIDEYLIANPNTAVILNVDRGYHWVAALKKVRGGYLCSDPYPYPAKNRTYHFDDIEGFAVIEKK